jgi:lipooligosaccharide transport system permease protein
VNAGPERPSRSDSAAAVAAVRPQRGGTFGRRLLGEEGSVSLPVRVLPAASFGTGRARRVLARNIRAYRRGWLFLVSGFFEPLFYLLSIGLGLNHLVGDLRLGTRVVGYATYVAPGLLAASAMNGSVFDSTFNIFFKLKITKSFDAMLATPLTVRDIIGGELGWALLRGSLYSAAFLVVMAVMGLVATPWVVLCLPCAALVGFAFGGTGMGLTTFMRNWQDFDLLFLAIMPLFLFSGVFYPLSVYPGWLQVVVTCTPLYQGVALMRGLDAGVLGWPLVAHVAYLAVLGLAGVRLATARLGKLLLP